MTEEDLAIRTRADLESENARLRTALEVAGDGLARLNLRRIAAEAQALDARLGTAAGASAHRHAMAGAASELAASQDLVTQLRVSRAALARSEERLSFAVAASGSLGWWDWDVVADRLYAGVEFARMFGVDPAAAEAGAPIAAFIAGIHPEDRAWVGERIGQALRAGGAFSEDYRLLAGDGTVTWIHARGCCYHDAAGRPVRYPGVAIDITDRKAADMRKDALVELGDRLRDFEDIGRIAYTAAEIMARAIGATRAGYGTVDPGRETVLMHTDWCSPDTASIAGEHRFRDYGSFVDDLKRGDVVIIDDVTTDPRTAALAPALLELGIRVLANVPIRVRGQLVAVVFVHHDRAHVWRPGEIAFIRTVADRTQAAIARVQAEEQQALLNRELSHRLKNTLALVQSIASQTLRSAADLDTAREALSRRLIALGKAHDVLIAAGTESAEIGDVVRGVLDLHGDDPERLLCAGPPLRIGPASALSLTLVLHELATNATKYGALSVPAGRIAVDWAVSEGEAPAFRLDWTESGGPPVAAPTHRGFGTRLIERGLSGGSVTTRFRPEGLACTLVAPLAGFLADG